MSTLNSFMLLLATLCLTFLVLPKLIDVSASLDATNAESRRATERQMHRDRTLEDARKRVIQQQAELIVAGERNLELARRIEAALAKVKKE